MAERSKAPDSSANLPWSRVERFLVSIGGVGSNPTSDIVFTFYAHVFQALFDEIFGAKAQLLGRNFRLKIAAYLVPL